VPVELYVQLTNVNRGDVRTLTKEECKRAFELGVTLGNGTAASTGLGLHTVVLGVSSAGGRAWLSTETLPATADRPAQAVTTFHFTLPMQQVEPRKRLSLNKRQSTNRGAGVQGTRAAATTAGKRPKAGAAAGAATTIAPVDRFRRQGKQTKVLEGLPFSWRDGDSRAALAVTAGVGSAREVPSSATSSSPSEHLQESQGVLASLQGGVDGGVTAAGCSSLSSEGTTRRCPSAEARWLASVPPYFVLAASNQSDEDSPTPRCPPLSALV
jgi:hypothetical protein